MKATHRNAAEIAQKGGAIAASDWTSGSGRNTSKRPVPELCKEILVSEINNLAGQSKKAAIKLIKNRPKIQKIIVVDNWRKLNKLIKAN